MSSSIQAPYLPVSVVLPEDYDQLLIRLTDLITTIFLQLNQREISLYQKTETITGEIWPSSDLSNITVPTTTFRKIFSFGAIAAGATLNIAHGLTQVTRYTNIYGTFVTNVPDTRPLPFVDEAVVTNQVSVKIAGANIVIINGNAAAPPITSGLVVLEYLKN